MASRFKEFIESLVLGRAPFHSSTFSVFHIFYVLELLSEKPQGRDRLAKKLSVGTRTMRTILGRLKDAGLIEVSRRGCYLAERGLLIWKKFGTLFPKFVEIKENELTISKHNYLFLVRNKGNTIKSSIELRDLAMVNGAQRAISLLFKADQLIIPSVSNNVREEFPKAANEILEVVRPCDNDVIIIASAESPLKSKRAAFLASWALIDV